MGKPPPPSPISTMCKPASTHNSLCTINTMDVVKETSDSMSPHSVHLIEREQLHDTYIQKQSFLPSTRVVSISVSVALSQILAYTMRHDTGPVYHAVCLYTLTLAQFPPRPVQMAQKIERNCSDGPVRSNYTDGYI